MIIRQISTTDLPALRDLAERTFRDAWQHMNEPEPFEAYCREHFAVENLAAELAAPDAEFYFAEQDGRPVAYLKLNLNRLPHSSDDLQSSDEWYDPALQLERIYVLQDVQGQRIGERLLAFTEKRARDTGAAWVWLSVWQKSPRSIGFYEKNGYEIFGIETFWVGDDPQPDWLMRKRLAPQ
ncbi:MAG: GNAT family N-acetyltransferase [Saprospiraceae bacterium]|nr:GNAT family N-acetyltransferase [Saprospiraceae bacterium]